MKNVRPVLVESNMEKGSDSTPYWNYIESKGRNMFDEWMKATDKTAVYPDSFNKELSGAVYLALGMNGEAGEVADEIKKIIRNDNGIITPERRAKLCLELGDVGWYWLRMIKELGFTVDEIMEKNIEKLSKRYENR